jgi:uncharacterized membrane protein YfcA
MITVGDAAILLAAGVLAGLVGSAGGITSLVSYTALIAIGVPPLSASVVNNVSMVGALPGAALGSRSELAGQGSWLRRWAPVAAAGGGAGAALLLLTSAATFARVVPFLVAAGSLALLLEPRMTRWRRQRHLTSGGGGSRSLAAWLIPLALYNGYFGAGGGVMILTLLLALVDRHLPTANALKNMLIGAASVIAAAIFAVSGSVIWTAAVPLGIGMFAGGRIGPVVARRLPAPVLRSTIGVLGLVLAVQLWFRPGL